MNSLLFRISTILALAGFVLSGDCVGQNETIDFNNDIRPILSDTCYKCHGPDEHDRKADLRLDTQAGLIDDSGAVVPGDLESSELYHRIITDDPDSLMPPPDSGRVLSERQKELVKKWIEQGATWENHWSLNTPEKPSVPKSDKEAWATNPIDNFVFAKLDANGLDHSPVADRPTLIRRVAFDLTGLPPSPEMVSKYTASKDAGWYENLVDELLGSPHYGEHMARYWLDAARYGDTHGLHLDNYREMWPYRDWVVDAFNQNLSYRDFTIEQLAGDLLENPTDAQKIASGFNRAHITTNEGGAITEEVYVRNVVDRVSTTGTVFLGMTVGCAQCHDHKFDPISQKEFYQLFAFFNNLTDPPMDKNIKDPPPVMKVMGEEQKLELAKLEKQLSAADTSLNKLIDELSYVDPADVEASEKLAGGDEADPEVETEPTEFIWIADNTLPAGAKQEGTWTFNSENKERVHLGTHSRLQESGGLIQHFFTKAANPIRVQKGDVFFTYVFLDRENPPQEVMLQFNDGNWEHRAYWGDNKIEWGADKTKSRIHLGPLPEIGKWVRLEVPAETVGFEKITSVNGMAFTQFGGKAHWDTSGVVSKLKQAGAYRSFKEWLAMTQETKGEGLPADLKKLATKAKDKLGDPGKKKLKRYFLSRVYPDAGEAMAKAVVERDKAQRERDNFNKSIPTTLISKENEKIKEAFVLSRGEYDKKGDKVDRITPAALPEFSDDYPRDRLGFAKWLTAANHPLTSRVAVNRFWQQCFGTGIVKTSEDFGAQGEMPSHPELLDWLSVDFVENDWDVRRLMKLIVMSSTYRQSSAVTKEVLEKDPENRLFARGPRFRLEAEMLRDQALSVSGLLIPKLGGPSVKPPQPDGLWFAVGYSGSNTVRFKKDDGAEKVHRRSLYTFWKRTAPAPQMTTFDAPSREECRVRRERTNTPLQALLLMNDPQYVEAARYFAQRAIDAEASDDQAKLEFVFSIALARTPSEKETKLVLTSLEKHREEFGSKPEEAKKLVSLGENPADEQYDAVELASWTMIANLVMNMDEFVTKN